MQVRNQANVHKIIQMKNARMPISRKAVSYSQAHSVHADIYIELT